MVVAPKSVDPISKTTPISNLMGYKGCLSVEQPRTLGGERKKKENSVENIPPFHTIGVGGGITRQLKIAHLGYFTSQHNAHTSHMYVTVSTLIMW